VGGRIRDADGGVTDYHATVRVTATFDSVCAVARQYASKRLWAEAVCVPLALAERDSARGNHRLVQLDLKGAALAVRVGQLGHGFTQQQAATLLRLIATLG